MHKCIFLFFGMIFLMASCSSDKKTSEVGSQVGDVARVQAMPSAQEIVSKLEIELQKQVNTSFLNMVLLVETLDPTGAQKVVEGYGGEVVYNPNFNFGNDIPFLLIQVPPELALNKEFFEAIKPLRVVATSNIMEKFERGDVATPVSTRESPWAPLDYVPTDEIGLDEFQKDETGLGEDTVIAIIDSGVAHDADVFQDRIVYVKDYTGGGNADIHSISEEIKDDKLKVSEEVEIDFAALGYDAKAQVYVGVFDESVIEPDDGQQFYDLNNNNVIDRFVFFAYKPKEKGQLWRVVVDINADKKFSEEELNNPIVDFNSHKKNKISDLNLKALMVFPGRKTNYAYSLYIEPDKEEGRLKKVQVNLAGSHGTHVAGIAAGGGKYVKGAAPKAKIMSIKVCSLTCHQIDKSLVEAFYNSSGIRPDAVNLSLGAREWNSRSELNELVSDLTAKFGAVFFFAGSNSGMGLRSLTNFSHPATVAVGATVSKAQLFQYEAVVGGEDLPHQMISHYSSRGPTFLGEQKPNIVAPGTSVSSLPLNLGTIGNYSGTSMAAPLASGGYVALVSKLKEKNAAFQKMQARLDKNFKIFQNAYHKDATSKLAETEDLIGYPLMVIEALQNSAESLEGVLSLAQGSGVLNVPGAYSQMESLLGEVDLNEYRLLKINYDDGVLPGYNRIFANKTLVNEFKLNIYKNAEWTSLNYKHHAGDQIAVKLEKVEVVESNQLEVLSDVQSQNFFHMMKRPQEDVPLYEQSFNMNGNAWGTDEFFSRRMTGNMKEGGTYIAHYGIYSSSGRLLNSIRDVIHMPYSLPRAVVYELTEGKTYAETVRSRRFQGEVKLGVSHRYFFKVSPEVGSGLDLSLRLESEQSGVLMMQIFNSFGKLVSEEYVYDSELGSDGGIDRTIHFKDTELWTVPGIYEVVVYNMEGSVAGQAKYSLYAKEIVDKSMRAFVSTTKWSKGGLAPTVNVAMYNPNQDKLGADTVFLSVEPSLAIEFKAEPGKWSFVSVGDLIKLTQERVGFSFQLPLDAMYRFFIVRGLYTKTEEGQFEPATKEPNVYKSKRVFSKGRGEFVVYLSPDHLEKDYYVAIESDLVFDMEKYEPITEGVLLVTPLSVQDLYSGMYPIDLNGGKVDPQTDKMMLYTHSIGAELEAFSQVPYINNIRVNVFSGGGGELKDAFDIEVEMEK